MLDEAENQVKFYMRAHTRTGAHTLMQIILLILFSGAEIGCVWIEY